jgi:DNA-binding transcriptional ArsR family regulator
VLDDTLPLAEIGTLVGDPARARMLAALLGGRALTANELAVQAGVAPPTASGHLAKLVAGGLVAVRPQGRHRYHTLVSREVARALESLAEIARARVGSPGLRPPLSGARHEALRAARTCYDHLAGRLAVSLADAMAARGQVEIGRDGAIVTREGQAFLRDFGVDVAGAARSRRLFLRTCLDSSERRLHLAGAVGAAMFTRTLELRWLRRMDGTRALAVTAGGQEGFRRMFGIDPRLGPPLKG